MAIIAQPSPGHLNGHWGKRNNDPFDQEECYARCTVAATRAKSLTVLLSPIDMHGLMGMMQVLAARSYPITQVYRGETNWQMPHTVSDAEMNKAQMETWNLSGPTSWDSVDTPPLAVLRLRKEIKDGGGER